MAPKPPYAGVSQKPHTVLIVEDNEDGRFMMRTFLQLKGYRVREARDGMEAIAAAASERPDLILMDLQLPRLDGNCSNSRAADATAITRHSDRDRIGLGSEAVPGTGVDRRL
jgi:DNA-binding response OmpR family regulator